jgi:hypothetical protein
MTSATAGVSTSPVEVQAVTPRGLWLWVMDCEYFLPTEDFPWFASATVYCTPHVKTLSTSENRSTSTPGCHRPADAVKPQGLDCTAARRRRLAVGSGWRQNRPSGPDPGRTRGRRCRRGWPPGARSAPANPAPDVAAAR